MIAKSSLLFRQTTNKQTPNSVYDTITSLLVQKKNFVQSGGPFIYKWHVYCSERLSSRIFSFCVHLSLFSVCLFPHISLCAPPPCLTQDPNLFFGLTIILQVSYSPLRPRIFSLLLNIPYSLLSRCLPPFYVYL